MVNFATFVSIIIASLRFTILHARPLRVSAHQSTRVARARARVGTRLEAVEIGADVVAGQVQHLALQPPVFLYLCLRLRRSPRQLSVRVAGFHDPAHGGLESRVFELEVNAKLSAEV